MTVYSSRHLRLLVAVLATVAVAWAALALTHRRVVGCSDPQALLDLHDLVDADLSPSVASDHDESGIARGAVRLAGMPFDVFVSRPYGLASHLMAPAEIFKSKLQPDRSQLVQVEADGRSLPVYFEDAAFRDGERIVAYLYVFQGEPVRSVLASRLVDAPAEAWSGSPPVTLIAVSGLVHRSQVEQARTDVREWMVRAWRHYRASCGE